MPTRARLAAPLLALASLSPLLSLAACSAPPAITQGQSGIRATYAGGELVSILPESARVPAVSAAVQDALRARGYSIDRAEITEETGAITARPPRTTTVPRVEVALSRVMQGTRVSIRFRPFGDEAASRSILDATLTRLGL